MMTEEKPLSSAARQRIDKWLFFTRLMKSRSLAQTHIEAGHIRINDEKTVQPSKMVKPGDRITLQLERRDLVVVVKLPGEKRGPYEEARLLYEDITPPKPDERLTAFEQAVRSSGSGRPTKKERRDMTRFRSPDGETS